MSLKKKSMCIGLNLIAPGIGQFFLKWWLRGVIQLFGALAAIFWAGWEVLYPIYGKVYDLMYGKGDAPIQTINFVNVGLAILLLIIIWGWSFADIIIFYKVFPDNPKEVDNLPNNPHPDQVDE